MTPITLIRKNLFEKRGRTLLLAFSIAIAFLIFGLLNGFANVTSAFESPEAQSRLMTMNRTGLLRSLPVSYAERIKKVEGVRHAVNVRIFGGYVGERRDSIPLLMTDPAEYLAASPVEGLAPDQRSAFISTRDGVIIDAKTAQQRGWKVGDRITIKSMLHANADRGDDWSFTVAGIFPAEGKDGPQTGALGHLAYLNENVVAGRDLANWVTIVVASPDLGAMVAERVDALFANSSHETTSMSERAMAQAFLGQIGDLTFIINLVVGAAFVALIFAVANTTALTIRQRGRQIGVLKAIGFTPGRILRMTIAETVILAAAGASFGLVLAGLIFSSALRSMNMPVPAFGLPVTTVLSGVGLALLLALLTGILPALRAMRVSPATAFGRG
ncbi:MAG TPA: ABC transporter permease [Allosphingosinicella sp.]|nr:ABC transporter permease [Allosphingosinicella sp.]